MLRSSTVISRTRQRVRSSTPLRMAHHSESMPIHDYLEAHGAHLWNLELPWPDSIAPGTAT